MIREVFNLIKNKYKNKSQHIESLKRQMADNPEKFKQMIAEQEQEAKHEEKEDTKEEEQPPAEGEEADAGLNTAGSARSKQSAKPKQKRPSVDKQTAYIEFKQDLGKPIENSIL